MQFEPLPEKRTVPAFVKKIPAQNVVLELMKADASERESLLRKIEAERKRADGLATALALQVHRKRGSDDPFIRVLTDLIAEHKVDAITYEGEPLTPELETAADIVEWLPAEDNEEECVAEAIEPEIRYQGRILHRAKLSCRKAREPEPEPEIMEPEQVVAPEAQACEDALPELDAEAVNEPTKTADVAGEEEPQKEAEPAEEEQSAPEQAKSEQKIRFRKILEKLFFWRRKPKAQEIERTTKEEPIENDDTKSENEKGAKENEDQ
jgi:hypothetical protein